jgi:hypothetical protein
MASDYTIAMHMLSDGPNRKITVRVVGSDELVKATAEGNLLTAAQ